MAQLSVGSAFFSDWPLVVISLSQRHPDSLRKASSITQPNLKCMTCRAAKSNTWKPAHLTIHLWSEKIPSKPTVWKSRRIAGSTDIFELSAFEQLPGFLVLKCTIQTLTYSVISAFLWSLEPF